MNAAQPVLRQARLGCIVTSGLVLSATVVVLGALTPAYNQSTETVSRLASPGQPFAVLAQAGIVLYGLLVLAGAQPLGDHLPGRERLLGGLISLFGAAAVTAGIAPKDSPLAARTFASRVHVDATILGGAAILVAMVVVSAYSRVDTARRTSAVVAILTAMTAILFRLLWDSSIYGLVERVLLALPALWLIALALQLWSIDDVYGAERDLRPRRAPAREVQPSTMRAETHPPAKLSPWPHVVWAVFVIGVVAVVLLALGQTRRPEGACSGIGFGCSLYGADAAGFAAIFIVPPAAVIMLVGHAVIAAARSIRRHGVPR